MSEAIFGLIGVCVGAFLNGGATYALERRRDVREARLSARMLLPEVERNRQLLRMILASPYMGHLALKQLEMQRWIEFEPRLAPSMASSGWNTVSTLYTSIQLFIDEAVYEPCNGVLSDEQLEWIRLSLQATADVVADLRAAAGMEKVGLAVDRAISTDAPVSGQQALIS